MIEIIKSIWKITFYSIDNTVSNLEVINLNYCNIGHSHIDHILECFRHVKHLKEVYLRGLNLASMEKAIGTSFLECRELEVLDIGDNNITLTNQGWHDALQDLIVNTKRLKSLCLSNTQLNEEEAANYIDALHMNSTLIEFIFDQHPTLADETINRIKKELNVNTLSKIERLEISITFIYQ